MDVWSVNEIVGREQMTAFRMIRDHQGSWWLDWVELAGYGMKRCYTYRHMESLMH